MRESEIKMACYVGRYVIYFACGIEYLGLAALGGGLGWGVFGVGRGRDKWEGISFQRSIDRSVKRYLGM